MKLFSLPPKQLAHFACNSPRPLLAESGGSLPETPVFHTVETYPPGGVGARR